MKRPVTLVSGQWADLPLDVLAQKTKGFGFDGLELACWGDHFDVRQGAKSKAYCDGRHELLARHGLKTWAISNHLAGQTVCDRIDPRHQRILPPHIWGDGKPDGVRQRAQEDMMLSAHAAKNLGVPVVNGFTGSSIWHQVYAFPPVTQAELDDGFAFFAKMWNPIFDEFKKCGVKFALEVHPTEIAFDIASAQRALAAVGHRPEFGFNYDPSHLGYQGVDYVQFIRTFADRINHVHMKDVWWGHGDGTVGVFGGHVEFGDARRYWDFRSLGHGDINFEEIIVALNDIQYTGPLSVEWEDGRMDREYGAAEACAFVRRLDFTPSAVAFDAAFERK
ncbi:MAG: sugar phosphate isomerase/epimerase [Kiritimatiellaeota bacterium]|nr:sugar phosphate isomerase/epimerase [Kiritimatiellota bacterium]